MPKKTKAIDEVIDSMLSFARGPDDETAIGRLSSTIRERMRDFTRSKRDWTEGAGPYGDVIFETTFPTPDGEPEHKWHGLIVSFLWAAEPNGWEVLVICPRDGDPVDQVKLVAWEEEDR